MVKTVTSTHILLTVKVQVATGKKTAPTYKELTYSADVHDNTIERPSASLPFWIIGRHPSLKQGHIHIADSTNTIGNKHGFFLSANGELYYNDNNSANGSRVNGKTIPRGGQVRIKPNSTYVVELGRFSKESKEPAVRIIIAAKETLATPQVLSASELTITYPKSGLPTEMYMLDVMDNDYIGVWNMTRGKPTHTLTARQIFIGREVNHKHIRIPSITPSVRKVDGEHGVFTVSNGFLQYTDLGSTGGSFLDDKKLASNHQYIISDGTHILGLGLNGPEQHAVTISINAHHRETGKASGRRAA